MDRPCLSGRLNSSIVNVMGVKIAGKLTVKRAALVKHITAVGTPTFGNGTQSALKAFDTTKPEVAKVLASQALTNPNVRSSIFEAMELQGIDDNVQLASIKAILSGNRESEVTIKHYGKDEKLTGRTVTHYKPSNKDILQANALLYKVTGRFDVNRALGKAMSDKLRAIAREFRPPKGSNAIIEPQRSKVQGPGPGPSGRGGGGARPARVGEDTHSHNTNKIPKGGVKSSKSKPSARKHGVKTDSRPQKSRKSPNSPRKIPKGGLISSVDPQVPAEANNAAAREAELLQKIAELEAKLKDVKGGH